MNLATLAAEAAARNRPVRIGLIGAGKFGSMFLSQVPTIAGIEVTAIAELDHARMVAACTAVGWTLRALIPCLMRKAAQSWPSGMMWMW